MSFDGGGCVRGTNLLKFIGINADELRCLSDADLKILIFKKSKEMAKLYEHGSKEKKKIIKIYKLLASDEDLRKRYSDEIMSKALEISKKNIKNGLVLNSISLEVIDIFKERFYFRFLTDMNRPCPKLIFSFNENGEIFLTDGKITEKVVDRKIIGCVRYGTKPYSKIEDIVKKVAISYQEEWYFNRYGHRCKSNVFKYDHNKAKNIPLDSFQFGIEHYIYPTIEEHSILLSLKEDGMVVPEGKVEGIHTK